MGPQIPQRLTDQTAERLLHMIGSDPAYRPGAKLPNEPWGRGKTSVISFLGVL